MKCIPKQVWGRFCPASEAGVKTIRFAREESNDDFSADFEISSFVELPQMIERVFKQA